MEVLSYNPPSTIYQNNMPMQQEMGIRALNQ